MLTVAAPAGPKMKQSLKNQLKKDIVSEKFFATCSWCELWRLERNKNKTLLPPRGILLSPTCMSR